MKTNSMNKNEEEQKKLKRASIEERQVINRRQKYKKYRRKVNREREKRNNSIREGSRTPKEFLDLFIAQSNLNNFKEMRT